MPESLAHKACKRKVAEKIGGKTEVLSRTGKRRYDVKRNNIIAEIECERDNAARMVCMIKYFLQEKSKRIPLGTESCDEIV